MDPADLVISLPDSEPYALPPTAVKGGGSIVFRPLARSVDGIMAEAMRAEGLAPRPAIDRATATPADVAALRAWDVKRIAHQVVRLEVGGADLTAHAPAILASIAERRPDVWIGIQQFADSPDTYGTPPAIDPEPIAGNL
jgi:hypothetical protein